MLILKIVLFNLLMCLSLNLHNHVREQTDRLDWHRLLAGVLLVNVAVTGLVIWTILG